MNILKTLSKNKYKPKPKTKQIDIPTEKELYNLIANIYILRTSQLMFMSANSSIIHLIEYTRNITNQIHLRIKNNKYDFTIFELIKYIDSAMWGINDTPSYISQAFTELNIIKTNGEYYTDSIFEYYTENIKVSDILLNPDKFIFYFYDSNIDNGINTKNSYYKLTELLYKQPFYVMASNKPIDNITTPLILKQINDDILNY